MQDKQTYRRREDESPFRLLTTRREALALYREIWRISALFDWPNERGRLWWAALPLRLGGVLSQVGTARACYEARQGLPMCQRRELPARLAWELDMSRRARAARCMLPLRPSGGSQPHIVATTGVQEGRATRECAAGV